MSDWKLNCRDKTTTAVTSTRQNLIDSLITLQNQSILFSGKTVIPLGMLLWRSLGSKGFQKVICLFLWCRRDKSQFIYLFILISLT